jgi:hypothetical protein
MSFIAALGEEDQSMAQKYPGRTREAQAALDVFMAKTGQQSDERREALEDLITDLLHLSRELGMNTLDSLQRATLVFCDEASEEKTQ